MEKMKEVHIVVDENQLSILLEIFKNDIGASLSILSTENDFDSVKDLANRLAFTIKVLNILYKV